MRYTTKRTFFVVGLAALFWQSAFPALADTFFVAENTNNTVQIFGPSGQLQGSLTSGLSGPGGLALFSNKLYVANSSNNTIEVFSLTNGQGAVFASTNLNQPSGLAFDKIGNLYAANYGNNTIVKFNSIGYGTPFATTGLNRPTGMAFDRLGNLYVANYGNGTIEEFSTNGVPTPFASGVSDVFGMVFDPSGTLYVSTANSPGSIVKFTTNGVGTVWLSGMSNPTGIGFDGAGNFYYLLPFGDTIQKVSTNGQGSLFAYDPGLCNALGLLIQSPLTIGCPTNAGSTNILGQCTISTNVVYGGNGEGVIPFGVDVSVKTNANFVPYTITRRQTMTGNFQELVFDNDPNSNDNDFVTGCNCTVAVGQQFISVAGSHVAEQFLERLASDPYVVMPVITNNLSARTATVTGFVWAKFLSLSGNGNWTLTLENVPSCGVQAPPADDSSVPVTGACSGSYTVTHDPDLIGTQTCPNSYTVTRVYRASDNCGDNASVAQVFTVNDSTPPWIECPSAVTVNVDPGKCTASNVNLGSPLAGTGCSGEVTLSSNAPAVFPKGTTIVTWRAVSPCGASISCQQSVTVVDNQSPSITCPAPLAVSCASAVPVPNPGSIVAADNCGSVNVTFVGDAITNQTCPDRYTVLRTYKATDAANNSVTCTQTITVNSTTAPGITAPGDVAVGTDSGQCYASGVALGSPVTSSPCSGILSITNNAPAIFPKGSTQVIWSATDSCGNSASATQNVVVTDSQAPLVACPANIVVNAQDTNGAIVAFSVTATDNCDSNLNVVVSPVSGSEFALGTTPVNCTVIDSAGNTNICSFNVTVMDPSAFNILSINAQNSDIALSWIMPLGLTGVVQGSMDTWSNDFTDVSGPFYAPGSGSVTNNYLDTGAQTNFPQRFYRIRLTP